MRHRAYAATGSMAFTLLLALVPGDSWAQAAPPDLSGTWVLNVEASDDLQEEFRRWLQARGMGAAGAPGGGGAPGAGSDETGSSDVGGGGGGASRGAGGGLLALMQSFTQNAETLIIAQSDPEVTITNAAGNANMVFTDGRVVESVGESGGKTKVKTRWKKDKMIIDIDFPSRPSPTGGVMTPSLTMTYSLDKNGRLELASSVAIGAAIPPFTVERVYDREAPSG